MNSCDLVLSLGCRLAPQFVGHDFSAFKNAKLIAVDIENDELKKKGQKINLSINSDLKDFLPKFLNKIKNTKFPSYNNLSYYCERLKKENPIIKNKVQKINLSEKRVLMKMLSSPGRIFSRSEIGKISNISKERSIDVMITRLRKKIEINPKNPKFLQTIRGSGYVLWIK